MQISFFRYLYKVSMLDFDCPSVHPINENFIEVPLC